VVAVRPQLGGAIGLAVLVTVAATVTTHTAHHAPYLVALVQLAIQEAGTDASRELRATLGVLRSQDCDGSGLDQLESLVGRARSAGLPVTVAVTGAQRPLPLDVDQAAYRIVQEALTNVSRHAGRARACVHLHYAPNVLTVQVSDDGEGVDTVLAGPGLGLIGMRERVSAVSGRLDTGPREGGGFHVRAELPIRATTLP
jgi:signal transduction histidine kinase